MNKKFIRILLDATMAILYGLLMFGYKISPMFHEVFGILIGVLFIIHVIIDMPLLKALYKKVKKKKGIKDIMLYISDIVLLIAMPIAIVTGVLISGVLFSFPMNPFIFDVHKLFSFIAMYILIGHTLFHTRFILGTIKSLLKEPKNRRIQVKRAAAIISVALIIVATASPIFSNDVLNNDEAKVNTDETNQNFDSDDEVKGDDEQEFDKQESDEQELNDTSGENDDEEVNQEPESDKPTLDEFLNSITCTGCSRGCSLLYPECGRGETQQEEATNEYNSLYGEE